MVAISPLLVILIPSVIGAIAMAILNSRNVASIKTKNRWVRTPVFLVVIGAIAGALGASSIAVPLQFCTFDPEFKHFNPDLTFGLGVGLIIVGIFIALSVANWLLQRFVYGIISIEDDTQQGAFNSKLIPALLLAPTMTVLLLFIYYPVSETFRLSTLLSRLGTDKTRFECLNNFTRMFDSPDYNQAVIISLLITASIVIVGLGLSLLIATMAYQPIPGARFYRIMLVWPYALSPVIAGAIFQLLLNPAAGIINHVLEGLFGFTVPWLQDPNIAPITVIITAIWNIMGYNILFYIAALQNVPKDLQEAASIDGANPLQVFWRITFPLVSPITFFLVVTNTTYAFFNTFGLIDFLTRGGPLNSTTTMMYSVYEVGIVNKDLGKGAAQSLILFLFVIAITIIQFRTSRNRVTYGA